MLPQLTSALGRQVTVSSLVVYTLVGLISLGFSLIHIINLTRISYITTKTLTITYTILISIEEII